MHSIKKKGAKQKNLLHPFDKVGLIIILLYLMHL